MGSARLQTRPLCEWNCGRVAFDHTRSSQCVSTLLLGEVGGIYYAERCACNASVTISIRPFEHRLLAQAHGVLGQWRGLEFIFLGLSPHVERRQWQVGSSVSHFRELYSWVVE